MQAKTCQRRTQHRDGSQMLWVNTDYLNVSQRPCENHAEPMMYHGDGVRGWEWGPTPKSCLF